MEAEVFLNDPRTWKRLRLVGNEGRHWARVPAKIEAFLERSRGSLTELLFDGLLPHEALVQCGIHSLLEDGAGTRRGTNPITIETLNIRNVPYLDLQPFNFLGSACIIKNLVLTKVSLDQRDQRPSLCAFPKLLHDFEALTINSGSWITFIPVTGDPGFKLSLPKLKSIVLHSSVPRFGSSSNLSVASSTFERLDLVGPSDSYLPLLFPNGYQPLFLSTPSSSASNLTYLRISLARMKPRISETDFLDHLTHFPSLTHLLLPASDLSDTTIQALTCRRSGGSIDLCPNLEVFDVWNSRRVTGGTVRGMIRSRIRKDGGTEKQGNGGDGTGAKLLAVRVDGCALYPCGAKWRSGWREEEKRVLESVWRDFV